MYPFKKSQFDKEVKLPWFLLITITAIAFGAIMEFVQRDFVANRSFDIWDILADSVGSVAGFIVARKRL
jgi:VanZ family protein